MGSDYHYPEEAPAHAAIVEGFWIDHYAVTNERFARFVNATGYVTLAEIPPRPEDYPGAALRVYSVCATRRGLAKNAAEAAYASHSSKKSLAAQ